MRLALLAAVILSATGLNAQTVVSSADPSTAKAGDVVTVSGEAMDATHVDALFLTNDKEDIQVEMSEQGDKVIKFKIPAETKPGQWSLMIRTKGDNPKLLEMPVRVTVQ